MKIAVLITCHNRKEKTLACLSSLMEVLPNSEVFLVDDGSTDGTLAAVKAKFPQVYIITGNGNLYWSRGMYTAWNYAIKKRSYDYYLWLNDDIELYPIFFEELINCYNLTGGNSIISGLIEDFNQKVIYGGYDKHKNLLHGTGALQEITFMNGNVVLIPQLVVDKIGILDPKFQHDLGDVDYGLRAIKAGIKVYSTRRAIALGYSNNFCRVRKWNTNIRDRLKILYSPLGANPKINFYFRKKHFGILNASLYWAFLHFINFLPDKLVAIFFGNRYCDKF